MNRKIILIILLFVILAAACQYKRDGGEVRSAIKQKKAEDIISETYKKDGILAEYPKFIAGGKQEEIDQWNQLILDDFKKILQIYSFNPFPERTPSPAGTVPTILNINYEIKLNTKNYISILYTAAYNSPYSAHPTDLIYTTNIDKVHKKRLKLSDMVDINKDFIQNFKTWDILPVEENNKELSKAIKDYITNLYNDDYKIGFETADKIGSGNLWGIFSYLTPEKLGISLGVPNYIGDHVELEKEYSDLNGFLKLNVK